MKKTILIITILIFFLTMSQSCKKDTAINPTLKTIYVSIDTNQTYQCEMGIFGIEDGVKIVKNPIHYSISYVYKNNNNGKVTYTYKPALNYTGTDEVELMSTWGSDGVNEGNQKTITSIKFTITN